jgi:hypothetical protein
MNTGRFAAVFWPAVICAGRRDNPETELLACHDHVASFLMKQFACQVCQASSFDRELRW